MINNDIKSIINHLKEGKLQNINTLNMFDNYNNEKNTSLLKPSFHCPECCLIPFINLKEKDMKVTTNCINGHNNEIPLKDYMEKCLDKNLNNKECSDCGLKYEPKKRFKFCSECSKIFCKNCLKKHNNNKSIINHETISLKKMDTFCCSHKTRYSYYCQICNKNICENCIYLHNNHQIFSLKDQKLSKNKIKELREKCNKEIDIINEIIDMFKNAINSIKKNLMML